MDFVQYLGPDTSISILLLLEHPSDLVRAASVSRAWRQFVINNGFSKTLCLKICPEVYEFARVMEVNTSNVHVAEVGSSTAMEWEKMASEHRIYSYLSHCIVSPIGKRSCIFDSISASSTDNYPDESIENTLEPLARVGTRPSYWSSEGQSNPAVPETLTYSLCSKLCIINEINIQPFKAYFQGGHPIYSAQAMRFRVGYSRTIQETGKISQNEGQVVEHDSCLPDVNYVWTYVSPIFPMVQVYIFLLPCVPRTGNRRGGGRVGRKSAGA